MALASLAFELDRRDAEQLTDILLGLGALSVSAEDAAAGTEEEQPVFDEPGEVATWSRLRLRVLLAGDADPQALMERACGQAGVNCPESLEVEAVPERDWVRETQAQFHPIRISGRLWVVPTWHTPPEPPAIAISLDPGVAFGTGSHPTTRLCLRWLDENLRGGESVLDYGCGSGILAIAAMKLGAASAYGVDVDAQAVQSSRDNALANQVEARFDLPDANLPQYDIVVANILTNPLKVLAPLLAAATRQGGQIVLSGILSKQAEDVMRIYAQWFDLKPPVMEDGWACLSGVKR